MTPVVILEAFGELPTELINVMTPVVILEAFGELPRTELINAETKRERRERDNPPTGVTVVGLLHAAFDARAELMGWSTTSSSSSRRNLWETYEAGLTGDDTDDSMIGWVYAGLANPTEPSVEDDVVIPEGLPDAGGYAGWAAVSDASGVRRGHCDAVFRIAAAGPVPR